ncbi:aspartate ammonia-lyase [Pasteurellaceae bacterium HPA106]|uniref:aspartate ammonia-lyase n=1 Tax=Spirabiliibacterium pneumoniae TaxID=221400 RepID=UPI001AAD9285|nr:aspartate ammonia-lyase [Spirabiliibacterium pneumoniae]MBE2896257.1 aspartate ammonia-lyase [Spirabiliibacterium pneumoniae]
MTAFRKEKDLLGERDVPADVYWGIHTLRAVENFNISSAKISDIPAFVRGMVMVKKAAAKANMELKVIPKAVGEAIVKACDQVLEEGKCLDQFPSDVYQGGAGTSVNMNTNEVVANLALEILGHKKGEYQYLDPMDHVNASQSTNDAYPTGFRIAVYTSLIELVEKIRYLQEGFEHKAKEFAHVMKMGRTQLQDAVPMSVGQEFEAFSVLLEEEIANLERTAQLLLEVNLGATAIGTGVNTPKGYPALATRYLAEVTGLPCTSSKNLIEATSDCGAYVMMHGALKRTAVKMSKVCNDLRLLSSGPRAGLNEINLPELQAGSSIMPAKVNPVVPEVVNQVCFKVFGNDLTVTFAAEAGQLQLNVMEPVIGQAMFETISLLANACVNLRDKCVDGITVNKAVCENYVLNSIGIITYLNPFIGHHNGDVIGKICAQTGRSVREVVLEKGLLSEEQLDDILSPENLMNPTYKAKDVE